MVSIRNCRRYCTKNGLLPFIVEIAHQSPKGQEIQFVPILAKFSAECSKNGLKHYTEMCH